MITSAKDLPTIDQATIDHYVAKGKRERSRAFADLVGALFSAPERMAETPRVTARMKAAH